MHKPSVHSCIMNIRRHLRSKLVGKSLIPQMCNSYWTHLGCQDPVRQNETDAPVSKCCLKSLKPLLKSKSHYSSKEKISSHCRHFQWWTGVITNCDALCSDTFLSWPALRFSFIWAKIALLWDWTRQVNSPHASMSLGCPCSPQVLAFLGCSDPVI